MNPQPQKSILLPILISVLTTALVFGGVGYYLGTAQTPEPTVTPSIIAKVSPSPKAIPSPSVSPSPSAPITAIDTSTWKTYTNSVVKISFKYPSDMKLEDSTSDFKGNTAQPVWIELNKTISNPCGMENPPGCTNDGYGIQFRAIESGNEAVSGFCHELDTPITIGGISGKIASTFHKVGEEGRTVSQFACVTSGKYTYHFGFYVDKDYTTKNKPYFEEFLNTVKLTK